MFRKKLIVGWGMGEKGLRQGRSGYSKHSIVFWFFFFFFFFFFFVCCCCLFFCFLLLFFVCFVVFWLLLFFFFCFFLIRLSDLRLLIKCKVSLLNVMV